jgi:uncharacterized membrane protein
LETLIVFKFVTEPLLLAIPVSSYFLYKGFKRNNLYLAFIVAAALAFFLRAFVLNEKFLLAGQLIYMFILLTVSFLLLKNDGAESGSKYEPLIIAVVAGLYAFLSILETGQIKALFTSVRMFLPVILLAVLIIATRFIAIRPLGKIFFLPLLLLYFFIVKLPFLFSEIVGLVNLLIHELLHTIFILFLMPDHPFLSNFAYRAIFMLLQSSTSLHLATLGLIFVLVWWGYRLWRQAPPEHQELSNAAQRRLKALFRRKMRIRSFILVLFISTALWSGVSSSQTSTLFDPQPQPILPNGKYFEIVLSSPMNDFSDGRLRKFIFSYRGKDIVFFVLKERNIVVAALDMCEVCPPIGYGQDASGQIICKYCGAPISFGSIGEKGGCNPVPVSIKRRASSIQISLQELTDSYNAAGK